MYKKWVIFIIVVLIVSLIFVVVRSISSSSDIISSNFSSEDDEYRIEDAYLRLINVSDYTISPGVLVVHDRNFSMNFLGGYIPTEYESLSEVGDPSAVVASLKNLSGVYDVFEVSLLEPQNDQIFDFFVGDPKALISYMAMIVPTNDGVVWLNSFPLYNESGEQQWGSILAEVLDMGTEENSPIGSGFDGGQPDLSRGAENIGNGTPTSDTVRHHPQFYEDSSIVRFDLNS